LLAGLRVCQATGMDVREAIRIATDYVKDLFPGSDYRLEEVTLEDDDSFEVTVSLRPADSAANAFLAVPADPDAARRGRWTLGIDATRAYKVVSVAPDGQVRGVRIRPIVVG
jgi:hypothetical protein